MSKTNPKPVPTVCSLWVVRQPFIA